MSGGELKTCPFCKEQIRAEAVKCRFCGEWIEDVRHGDHAGKQQITASMELPAIDDSAVVAADPKLSESRDNDSTLTKSPVQKERSGIRFGRATLTILPLILIVLVVWQAGVSAMQKKASGFIDIASYTLSDCTTPFSLIVLVLSTIWFGRSLRRVFAHRRTGFVVGVCLIIVPIWLCLSWLAVSLAFTLTSQHQSTSTTGFNPHALEGWEVTKRDQHSDETADGLSAAQNKRLREMMALQLKSNLTALPNISVNLDGTEHDKLVVSFGNMAPSVAKLADALKEQEPDFWNQMRFFNFGEIVLTGAGQYEAIPASKFIQWTRGYDAYVSSVKAVYDSQLFGDRGAQENPAAQKVMRQRFASTLDGGLRSIYTAIQVRLEGDNEDKLLIYMPQMNSAIADDLIQRTRQDGNLWNGVRALGFSGVIMSGNTYRRSISRTEFIPWCRDYEKYLSQVQEAMRQTSGALRRESSPSNR